MKIITFLFCALGIFCLTATAPQQAAAQVPCFQIQNFTSICVKPTAPRKLTLNFKIVANQPGTSVLLSAMGGTLNNQSGLTIALTGNQATVSVTYDEITPNTTVTVLMTLQNGANPVCRMSSAQTLVQCGNNCGTMTMNLGTQQAGYVTPGATGAYPGAMIMTMGGITAGPEKVSQIKTTITSVQRRTKCVGAAPGPYQNVSLVPVALQQGCTVSGQSLIWTKNPPADYTSPTDFPNNFGGLPAKLNPNCPEEYQLTLQVTITFANGCTKTQSFTITTVRP